jgi:hypothetical protein
MLQTKAATLDPLENKLGVSSRAAATAHAYENKLI